MCAVRDKLHAQEIIEIRLADALSELAKINKQFDIIFIDPPFALNLHEKAIKEALLYLKEGGYLYIESPKEWDAKILSDLKLDVARQSDAGAVTFRLVSKQRDLI